MNGFWGGIGRAMCLVPAVAGAAETESRQITLPSVVIDYSGEAVTIFRMQGMLAAEGLLVIAALVLAARLWAMRRKVSGEGAVAASRVSMVWTLFFLLLGAMMALAGLRVWVFLRAFH